MPILRSQSAFARPTPVLADSPRRRASALAHAALAALALALAPAHALADSSIRLRSWARVSSDQITLADVADIQGDDAPALMALTIDLPAPDPAGWATVDIDLIRAALKARPEFSPSTMTLQGGRCAVRVSSAGGGTEVSAGGGAGDGKPAAAAHAAPAGASSRTTPAQPVIAREGTLRALIIQRLADLYDVSTSDLRVVITGKGELDAPPPAGHTLVIEPGASSASGRVPLRIDAYSADAIATSMNFTAQVEVRRRVLITCHPLARGDAFTPEQVREEPRWLSAGAPAPVTLAQLARAQARRAIAPGSVITTTDIQSPIMVRRGEETTIHVLSGGVRLKIKARALREGRQDDIVPFRMDGSKRTLDAKVSARGEAVKVVGGDQDAPQGLDFSPASPEWTPEPPPASAPSSRANPPRSTPTGWDVSDEEIAAIDAARGRQATPARALGAVPTKADPAPANRTFFPLDRDNASPALRRSRSLGK